MRRRLQVTHHQEAILRLGTMVSHRQVPTHQHMVPHLQATMGLHRLDTHHQAIHLRVLHRLATLQQVIHHQEVERRQAILQRQANMEVHQAVEDLLVGHQAITPRQASKGHQVEALRHKSKTAIMLPLAVIPMLVLQLKIHMAGLQMLGTPVAHLAARRLPPTTTGTAAAVMVAGMRGVHLHLQVTTTGNHSPVVIPTRKHRQPMHQLRIHTTTPMAHHLLSNLQAAIHMVEEVVVVAALIAIVHIDDRTRLSKSS